MPYEPNLIYLNASLFNPSDAKQNILAYTQDSRSTPILQCPADWECSVVRFDISAGGLPPIVVPMPGPAPSVPSVVPSTLRVTLRSLGVDYQQIVQVFSSSPETYGFVFSIDELMTRFNNALALAFAAMPAVAGVTSAPIFAFDPVTQLIKLYYQATYDTAPVEIYMNTPMYNCVRSIPAALLGINLANGKDFLIQTHASSVVQVPAVGARDGYPVSIQAVAGSVWATSQAGVSLGALNGVRSIFITTDLPITVEGIPTNVTATQGTTGNNNAVILSDFLMSTDPDENPVADRVNISYLPTAEYRMCQLSGKAALTRMNLQWFFTLYDGSVRPVTIPPGGVCSAKILFRRAAARDTYA